MCFQGFSTIRLVIINMFYQLILRQTMSRETSVRNVQLYKHYLRVSRNEKETSSIGGVIFHWSPNEQVNLEGRFVFAIKICLKIIYLR